jgi:peptidyl-prolyl cis-trans isomerase SurA
MTGQDGSDNLEKTKMDPVDAYQIAGLNKGDITEPYEIEEGQSKKKQLSLFRSMILYLLTLWILQQTMNV